ncbi:hypothetical protein G3480_17380 [Thiorhodococcus mannitoliphagus]|uniref:Uncharacterized protein n=1 Tax=Thiorhodococcus mannitoliphagus TaxID=329406 RepID=A0A6P1DUP4_9GAMM|nr:hypothetical protein [Thiorhodococcus mannitoliphagus]
MARALGVAAAGLWLANTLASEGPIMGLAYQPYVGQWSQRPDNPYAPGNYYIPAFNTYSGGIDPKHPEGSLVAASQKLRLTFDTEGRLTDVTAQGALNFNPNALRNAGAKAWSRTYFRSFEGRQPGAAQPVDHQGSVFRQLSYLVSQAGGAPLTLTTYGTGFQAGYWQTLEGLEYAVFPIWTAKEVAFINPGDADSTQTQSIEQILFYFPPTSAYVRPDPALIRVETRGQPGRDLELGAVDQRLFSPSQKGTPGALLNPGFFVGDANAQIALAAAEINAQAGERLLSIKLGVDNLAVAGSLVNDRMRFGILSALAQAQLANARFPNTVTHLIVSNEYARIVSAEVTGQPTPTQQTTEMVRFAKAQMEPEGDFAGVKIKVGVRGNQFVAIAPTTGDPAIRQFTQDVAKLVSVADFLMENRYPSPEAVESARQSGHWKVYFDPMNGELSKQWRALEASIRALPGGGDIDLMIGEIGHPTNGISFNLAGYRKDNIEPKPGTAFAQIAATVDLERARIAPEGIRIFQRDFNDTLATAFVHEALDWSRRTGVQLHLFEAFDEPHKASPNLPLPGLSMKQSLLNQSGSYGAEAYFGLFGYTGVAAFQGDPETGVQPRPGGLMTDTLPPGVRWASQFKGTFYAKLPDLDFAGAAHAFKAVTPP